MSAEQQNDFNLSGKSKDKIIEYLKTLEDDGRTYIFNFKHTDAETNIDVIVSRKRDKYIAIKTSGDNLPHGKNFAIISYATSVKDNEIVISEEVTITNIKEKPVPEVEAPTEEELASFMISIQEDETDKTKEKDLEIEALPVISEESTIIDELDKPNFEFSIEDIEEEVEVIDVIVQQKLSQWELQISEEKRKSLISELLLEYYKKNKNISLLDRESQVFVDLDNDKLNNDIDVIISEFKPYKQLIIDGKFMDTNIYPIVEDKKIYYSNQSVPERDEPIKNITVLPRPVASVTTDDEGMSSTGELEIKIQLVKDYYSGKIDGYKSFITKLFEGGDVHIEDEETGESLEVSFDNLYATHLPASNDDIESEYYTIDNQKIETEVFRNCNVDKKCAANPMLELNENNLVDYVKRKSISREYYLNEIYDEKDIVDNRGNRKKDVRTCNGTNKTGDTLYILGDDKLRKSITKPPEKKDMFQGETLKVVGLFIQSPYSKFRNILANREYTNDDNSKIYPKIYNDSLDLGDIGIKHNHNNDNIEIIDDITSFSYDDYDPSKNYFVYFNKTNKKAITKAEYINYIDSVIPNTTQIIDIEIDNIKKADSINEVNKIINKYGLDFLHLSIDDVKKIGANVVSNIRHILEQKVVDNIMKYDRIELNNKFIKYNEDIVNILYEIENTTDKTDEEYMEKVIMKFNERINNYLSALKNLNILKIFAEKFLNISNDDEELDDPEVLKEKIIARILEREGVADNRSFLTKIINRPSSINSEIAQFIESYKIVNGINMSKRLYISNLEFYANKLNELSFIKQIKNTTYGGEEFLNVLNLVNLLNIKATVSDRITDDITRENLIRLDTEYKSSVSTFNREKEQYIYYLTKCNSVKIKKIYSSLDELIDDNDKDVEVDDKFSNLGDIVRLGVDLYSNNKTKSEPELVQLFKDTLNKKYMFLSRGEVDNFIHRFNTLRDENGIDKLADMKITDLIQNNDYALLDSDKKYLFFRKSNKWISIDKDAYSQIQKCYLYNIDLLKYSLKEIENICSMSSERETDENIDCIKIGDNHIPSPMYRTYLNIEMINKKRILVAKLIEYNETIDSKIQKTKLKLNSLIKRVHNKKVYATNKFNYAKKVKESKLVYPPKKQRQLLEDIYKIRDFDLKIEKLYNFIDEFGLLYSNNPKHADTDEANEYSAKWIYYDSTKVDVPICCKHYLDYKKMLFKDNNTREKVIKELREKWSKGEKSGEYYICANCGEPIDNIKYSEFEGFGKDNKVINFREKVVDTQDSNSFIMPSLIVTKNSSYDLLNLLVTKLGIILREDDFNYIMEQMTKVSDNMLNLQQFFATIYKNKNLIDKDILSSDSIIRKSMKKTPDKIEEFKIIIKGLLNEFIENYTFNTSQEFEQSIKEFMDQKKSDPFNKKAIIIIYKELMYKLKNSFESYRAGMILNNVLVNLSQVLIYSLPTYRLVSLGAERREKKSGFFVQNLYKNPELAIPLLYNRVFQENTATKSQPEIKRLFISINLYFRNILDVPFTRDINESYLTELKVITEGVQNTDYINNLIMMRNIESISTDQSIKDYSWPTFLPPLEPNISQTPASLGVNSSIITQNIESYVLNKSIIQSKQAEFLVESTQPQPNIEILNKLSMEKHQVIANNRDIKHRLNNFYTKLGFLYMSVLNRIIIDIDNSPYNISSYVSSLGFDKLNSKYTDFFLENFPSDKSLIQNIEIEMKQIDDFLTSHTEANNSFDMIKLDHKPRNLQKYMTFNSNLYKNEEEINKYLMKQLKLINSITILEEGDDKYKKRHYKILMDEDYKLYVKFLLDPENADLSDIDIETQFIEYFKVVKNVDLSINTVKKDLILKHKGYALIDIVSKQFKSDIEKRVETNYSHLSNEELFEELDRLNTEFNKSSIIDKTKTYPMINNLVPFKHNILESLNKSMNNYINSIGRDILLGFEFDENISDRLHAVKFDGNINSFIENLEKKRRELNTYSLANITSLKTKIKLKDYLNSDEKTALIFKLIDIDGITLLNDDFYSEISLSSEKFIKISNSDKSRIQNQIQFKNMLTSINKYNSDINIFTNILTIVLGFINKIKHLHINPQGKPDMKLHVKLDNKEDNLFFYGTTFYKEKLENLNNLSELIIKKQQEGDDIEFISMLPDTSDSIDLLRKLLSLNKEINNNGNITNASMLIPAVIRLYIHDLIIFYLLSIFEDYESDTNSLLFQMRTIVLDEIANYLFFVNRKDEDIILTIKTKRARENINRKAAFDRMSTDMQNTQKLFRRFNIGTIFEGYADEDVEINELVMQGNDMAEDSRLNLGITDEEAEQQMMSDLAMGDQYDDTQLGIGIHGNDEMVNLYGGDDE